MMQEDMYVAVHRAYRAAVFVFFILIMLVALIFVMVMTADTLCRSRTMFRAAPWCVEEPTTLGGSS